MNKQLRKPVIAGNWKMNNTPAEATALIEALKPLVKDADCEVVCCVPYIDLYAALEAAKGQQHTDRRGELPLGGEGRFHRRSQREDAQGRGRTLCYHRPQRAQTVLRRDRRHCPQPRQSSSQRRPQGHPLRGRGSLRAQGRHNLSDSLARRPRSLWAEYPQRSSRTSSSPMSPSGLSARARPQLPSRPTRSAPLSALLSRDFTARTPRTQLLSSTAAR